MQGLSRKAAPALTSRDPSGPKDLVDIIQIPERNKAKSPKAQCQISWEPEDLYGNPWWSVSGWDLITCRWSVSWAQEAGNHYFAICSFWQANTLLGDSSISLTPPILSRNKRIGDKRGMPALFWLVQTRLVYDQNNADSFLAFSSGIFSFIWGWDGPPFQESAQDTEIAEGDPHPKLGLAERYEKGTVE